MATVPPHLEAVAALAWGERPAPEAARAAELGAELAQILAAARAAAAGNDFSDEPFQFAAVLARLADPQDPPP